MVQYASIAQGHRREISGEFIQFLRMAQGSLKELEIHLTLSPRVGIAKQDKIEPILAKTEELGRMLRSLMRALQNRRALASRNSAGFRARSAFSTRHSLFATRHSLPRVDNQQRSREQHACAEPLREDEVFVGEDPEGDGISEERVE